jgi:DNA-binding response OmpR family regulator
MCELLRIFLEKEGYQVETAFNGAQAVSRIQGARPRT